MLSGGVGHLPTSQGLESVEGGFSKPLEDAIENNIALLNLLMIVKGWQVWSVIRRLIGVMILLVEMNSFGYCDCGCLKFLAISRMIDITICYILLVLFCWLLYYCGHQTTFYQILVYGLNMILKHLLFNYFQFVWNWNWTFVFLNWNLTEKSRIGCHLLFLRNFEKIRIGSSIFILPQSDCCFF